MSKTLTPVIYNPPDYLELYDFRIRVFRMYQERNQALGKEDPQAVWQRFRAQRDDLFARHSQSALTGEHKGSFSGLDYFPYKASASVEAVLDPSIEPQELRVTTSGESTMLMRRVALARCVLQGKQFELAVYWIDVYGGGLFLPFRDATAGDETYGGGRYLFDTIKGSDFISQSRSPKTSEPFAVLLDFNYAYNPSCAYNSQWVCPLAPPENRLAIRIEAGEKKFKVEDE